MHYRAGKRDVVSSEHGQLTAGQLESFLVEIDDQPSWRKDADREADFYDGNQLDSDTLRSMEERGIPPVVVNLIKPVINTVLGMEAKLRRDWVVRGDTDEDTDMADALSVKMAEVDRMTRGSRACADAHSDQIKVGLGWVGVHRQADPFKYPYKVEKVHRNEIWFDWRSREYDLSDARYLVRRKWYDTDTLKAMFPGKARLIDEAVNGAPWWDNIDPDETDLARSLDSARDWRVDQDEWISPERSMAALYEVWYRVWVSGHVFKTPDGRTVEFDRRDLRHVLAYRKGLIKPFKGRYSKVRLAWWVGPFHMHDQASPYSHGRFPYIPFWGYREDLTGVPYGMIRDMKSPQEEVNARRSKMLWLLSSSRVIVDEDAVKDHDKVRQEVARPDAYIVTNSQRQNPNGFSVNDGGQLSAQQASVLQESKANIQEASGIFHEAMGEGKGGGQSGVAIRSLVEQSATTIGEIMDNYQESRRLTGELLLSLIVDDLQDEANVAVNVPAKSGGGEARTVYLNAPTTDELGQDAKDNDITRMLGKVALDDIPNTPTYRQQVAEHMMQLAKNLPPELQAVVMDTIIESLDVPNRHEIAERIRKATGQGKPSEEQQQAQAKEQEMAQRERMLELKEKETSIQKMMAEIEERMAKIPGIEAQAAKTGAEAEHTQARTTHEREATRKTGAEIEHTQAETEYTEAQTDNMHVDTVDRVMNPGSGDAGADPQGKERNRDVDGEYQSEPEQEDSQ